MLTIDEACFPEQLDSVRDIFLEYAASLPVDLAFQDFAGELAALPGKYAAPAGRVLLASIDGDVVGCVALRPLDADSAEMKRLYVRPAGRGRQLGRQLAEKICALAQAQGYRNIRLDTMPVMTAAQHLYGSLGFRQIEAYVYNPVEGTRFMELDLDASSPGPG
jgi:ribosomal protein S18 acetylase RimI-like enzyme